MTNTINNDKINAAMCKNKKSMTLLVTMAELHYWKI